MRRTKLFVGTLFATCTAAVLCASPVQAASYGFIETGFTGGATLTGSFTASDLNSDGLIEYDVSNPALQEVTDFSATFSGNSLVGSFHLTFADLATFEYDTLATPAVLQFVAGNAGPGAAVGFIACNGSIPCSAVGNSINADFSSSSAVASVPEPASWALMIFGFGSIGAALRASRRKIGQRRAVLAIG